MSAIRLEPRTAIAARAQEVAKTRRAGDRRRQNQTAVGGRRPPKTRASRPEAAKNQRGAAQNQSVAAGGRQKPERRRPKPERRGRRPPKTRENRMRLESNPNLVS